MSTPTEAPAVNRSLLYVLAAVVVAALLFLFVVKPLLLSDDDGAAEIPVATDPDRVPDADADDEVEAGEPVPETFEVFSARDPFQQLASAEVEAPDVETADEGGVTPVATTDGEATGTDADAEPRTTAEVGGTVVRLSDVVTDEAGQPRAVVAVNGTGYEVAEGQTFAERLKLLDITDECATFLFGDNRFVLCKGEQIRK